MKIAEMIKEDQELDKELEALESGGKPAAAVVVTADEGKKTEDAGEGKTGELALEKPEIPAPVQKPAVADGGVDWKAENERLKAEIDKLTHQHAVLQGKYFAEVPRVTALNNEIKTQLADLQAVTIQKDQRIQELESKTADNVAAKPEGKKLTSAAIERFREEHGDEFAENMKQLVDPLEKLINDQSALIEGLKEKLASDVPRGTVAPAAAEATFDPASDFYGKVFSIVPDWLEINGDKREGKPPDPKWLAFIETIEPSSGFKYRDIAMGHQKVWNAEGFANVFTAFKSSIGGAPDTTKGNGGFQGLEEHVDPATIGKGPDKPSETTKTYTRAEVDKFYDDLQRRPRTLGLTSQEITARQKEYDDAELDGRVR